MRIIQKQDGSGEIVFSWKEIWILIKKRKLVLTPEALKDLSNNLVKIAIEFNEVFNEKIQRQETFSDEVNSVDDKS
tara:strand:- start:671 stop:898 length:228 start_codon:yes stop_codon:yes gene_type:complete